MTDVFDSLLTDQCAILAKATYGSGSDDAYGQPPQTFITKIASWPCRVSTMTGGNEYKVGKEFAKNTFKVFMRPPTVDDDSNAFSLTTHNWLRVDKANGGDLAEPMLLNIQGVNNPSLLAHHLEVISEQVIP